MKMVVVVLGKFGLFYCLYNGLFCSQILGKASSSVGAQIPMVGHPSSKQWRQFHKMMPDQRNLLWRQGQQPELWVRWSWKWKLAWIASCRHQGQRFCRELLTLALFDKALVVRAQAASVFGDLYTGSADQKAISLLARAYGNPKNYRQSRPLFVQFRILYSLFHLGGDSRKQGALLSQNHPDTLRYWSMINKNAQRQGSKL